MISTDDLSLDCSTCVAVNTTACGDCVVQHLLANDAGPIDFVPTRVGAGQTERAVELFARAGLLDPDPHFVAYREFESPGAPRCRGEMSR